MGRLLHANSQDTDLSTLCPFPIFVEQCNHNPPTLQTDGQTNRQTIHARGITVTCIYCMSCRSICSERHENETWTDCSEAEFTSSWPRRAQCSSDSSPSATTWRCCSSSLTDNISMSYFTKYASTSLNVASSHAPNIDRSAAESALLSCNLFNY